jgi:hypothetical protein
LFQAPSVSNILGRLRIMEPKMKIARPIGLRGAALSPAGRPVARRQSHAVEYCLVVAILCFASVSTFTAVNFKHGSTASDRVDVRYQ